MGYDPDNWDQEEADHLQAELERAGRRAAALAKKGICVHGHRQGPPEQSKCLDCGKVGTDQELQAEREMHLYGG